MLFANDSKWRLGALAAQVVLLSIGLNAQNDAHVKSAASDRCTPSRVSTPDPEFPPLEGGKPVKLDAPTAELLIRENGTVKSARLIRSSNVGAWDQVFLTTMQKWKFSKAPGCGIRKTTVSIDIDIR
jgi:TonB family protein